MKFLFVVVGLARLAGHEVRGSGRGKRPLLSLPFALNSHGSFSPRPCCLSHEASKLTQPAIILDDTPAVQRRIVRAHGKNDGKI